MSIASITGGRVPKTAPSVHVIALTTPPMRSERPGNVPSSHRRHRIGREGAGPVRSGIRAGAAISARYRVRESEPRACLRAKMISEYR